MTVDVSHLREACLQQLTADQARAGRHVQDTNLLPAILRHQSGRLLGHDPRPTVPSMAKRLPGRDTVHTHQNSHMSTHRANIVLFNLISTVTSKLIQMHLVILQEFPHPPAGNRSKYKICSSKILKG